MPSLFLILSGCGGKKNSAVNLLASKMEVSLKKAEPITWARLDLPSLPQNQEQEDTNHT